MLKKVGCALCKRSAILGLALVLSTSSAVIASDTNSGCQSVKIQSAHEDNVKVQDIDKIVIGDMAFTVKSVCESQKNGYKTASEGKKLVGINLIVENNGTKEQQMTSVMMFKLIDSKKQKYSIALPEGPDSLNGLLAPKASMSGSIWFEVPKEETQFQLVIRPSMPEQQTGTLDINTSDI